MAHAAATGRPNQRSRTRKDLLEAASRLMKQGLRPSLEDVAEEALVSRATAYRYFSSADALLVEASVDVDVPQPEELFSAFAPDDPVARLERVDTALHEMMRANETPLRIMLADSLQRAARGGHDGVPARQNRRTPLIEAALAPAHGQFTPDARDTLAKALALVIGTEAMIVLNDVLQLDDDDARHVKQWAIRALVDAARRSPSLPG